MDIWFTAFWILVAFLTGLTFGFFVFDDKPTSN